MLANAPSMAMISAVKQHVGTRGTGNWDGPSMVATAAAIAALSASSTAVGPVDLFDTAMEHLGTEEDPAVICLCAHVANSLAELAGRPDLGVRFVPVVARLIATGNTLCEESACSFVSEYVKRADCRRPLSDICLTALEQAATTRRGREEEVQQQCGGAAAPSAAARVCSALVGALDGVEGAEGLLDEVLEATLRKLSASDAATFRTLASAVLPRFTAQAARERVVACACARAHDPAGALMILCSAPAAVCALPARHPLASSVCEIVRGGLCDKSHTVRKRAQYVLGQAVAGWGGLAERVGWGGGEWGSYVGILDACEDTSSHIMSASWEHIPSVSDAASPEQAAEQLLWLEAVMHRSLRHSKVPLRHRALRTIASHPRAHLFSQSFVLEGVLAAANDQIFLKACGINSESTAFAVRLAQPLDEGDAPEGWSMGECVVRVLHRHVQGLPDDEARRAFLTALYCFLKDSVAAPRCCLLGTTAIALSALAGPARLSLSGEGIRELTYVCNAVFRAARNTSIMRSHDFAVCRLLASLGSAVAFTFDQLAALLAIPPLHALTEHRVAITAWLSSLAVPGAAAGVPWMEQELTSALQDFLLYKPPAEGAKGAHGEPATEEELGDAHARAGVLARVCAFYTGSDTSAGDTGSASQQSVAGSGEGGGGGSGVLSPVRKRLGQMHSHAYLPRLARERAMALLVALEGYSQDIAFPVQDCLTDPDEEIEICAHALSVVSSCLEGRGAQGGGLKGEVGRVELALSALEAAHAISPTSPVLREVGSSLLESALAALGGTPKGPCAHLCALLALHSAITSFGAGMGGLEKPVVGARLAEGGASSGVREREWSDLRCMLNRRRFECLSAILLRTAQEPLQPSSAELRAAKRALLGECLEGVKSGADGHAEEALLCVSLLVAGCAVDDGAGGDAEVLGGGLLTDEKVDAELVWEAASLTWNLIYELQQDGKTKTKATVAWSQVSRDTLLNFLRSAFHPRLWAVRSLHEENGPLRRAWMLCWKEAQTSIRLMKVLVTHTCSLWRRFPETISLYKEQAVECCMHGLLAVSDSVTDVAFDGAACLDPELVHNDELLTGRQTYIRVLTTSMLVRLCTGGVPKAAEAARDAAIRDVYMGLLAKNFNPEINTVGYGAFSTNHRIKMRIFQALAVLSPHLTEKDAIPACAELIKSVYQDERKSVRHYAETACFTLMRNRVNLWQQHLLPLLQDYNMNTAVASSIIVIANYLIRVHVLKKATREEGEVQAFRTMVEALLPWTSHHSHFIRVLASLAIKKFHFDGGNSAESASAETTILTQSVLRFQESNHEVVQLHDKIERVFFASLSFEAMCDHTEVFRPAVKDGEVWGERIPEGLAAEINEEMNQYQKMLHEANENLDGMEAGEHAATYQRKYQPDGQIAASNAAEEVARRDNTQKTMDSDASQKEALSQVKRGKMIVVASLIDKMPNLAGLARTCEVFQATELVVANKDKLLKDEVFKSVAVSSDRWVPISEVNVENLPRYLQEKRSQGWALVGLEQSSDSVPLHKYKFPSKSILILGAEKEGVPQHLIQLLDDCVEIPQLGLIRSLNVHVSGACTLWQWTQQGLP